MFNRGKYLIRYMRNNVYIKLESKGGLNYAGTKLRTT